MTDSPSNRAAPFSPITDQAERKGKRVSPGRRRNNKEQEEKEIQARLQTSIASCTLSHTANHSTIDIFLSLDSRWSAILEVVTRYKTRSSTVPANNLRFPPAVILQAQDSEDVSLAER
jgi:hypothetical protein